MDKEVVLKNIGKELKALRIKSGFTSYESFAYTHNIQRQTVYRAESGKNITIETLVTLLNSLDTSLEDFFKGFK